MHAIFLNGPPRSGKDTVADILVDTYGARAFKAAAPLRRAICGFLGVDDRELEACKDVPLAGSVDVTPRHLMQGLSEDVIKPLLGSRYFGLALAKEIREAPSDMYVVSDAGFQIEMDACADVLRTVPGMTLHLWRVDRPGCTFDGDTREYVAPHESMEYAEIYNDGDMVDLRLKVQRLVNRL